MDIRSELESIIKRHRALVDELETLFITIRPDVDASPVPTELREFLEQNECLDEYVVEHCDCTAEWFENAEKSWWIFEAFIWGETPSGEDFWEGIDKKWEAHLEASK